MVGWFTSLGEYSGDKASSAICLVSVTQQRAVLSNVDPFVLYCRFSDAQIDDKMSKIDNYTCHTYMYI